MTGNVYKRRQRGWTAKTHTRPRLEAVPSIFKFVIQSMRYVPSLYDYILHVNVSYAWGSILISGRPNSVFSLARSLVRSPSRSPAARTAFVPRRRRAAKSRPPTSRHYNLRRAEANRILLPSPDSSILFSPLLQAYISNLQKMQNKVHVKWISATQLLIQKSVPKMKRIWKRKRSQVPLLQRKTTPSSLPPNSIKNLVSIGRLWLLAALLPTSNQGSVT